MKIFWLDRSIVHAPARLGMCPIPGKDRHDMAAKNDIDTLISEGVTYVISLVEEKEFLTLKPPETIRERELMLHNKGIEFESFPIVDFSVPSIRMAKKWIGDIHLLVNQGESIVVHCWAGLGRAGTVLACYLVSRGLTVREAIAEVRWMRPLALQSKEQEEFIFEFARW